jgi:hypothetical protein
MASKTDVRVFESLSIVKVRGYKPTDPDAHHGGPVDRPGDANCLLESYGMAGANGDGDWGPGVMHSDYDYPEWDFAVLIASDEVDAFRSHATLRGYEILSVEEVTEPTNFGDGSGTVEILKHRDGWVVLD